MRNYVQPGNNLDIAAPYAVEPGQGVLIGALFGVACDGADNGAPVTIATVGVYDLAKGPGDIFTVGAPVMWDTGLLRARSGNDEDSNSAGESEAIIGVAVAAAGAGTLTVRVKLGTPVTLV